MVSGWFPVWWGSRIRKIRRIGPAGYKSSFAAGRETPKSNGAAELVAHGSAVVLTRLAAVGSTTPRASQLIVRVRA